MEGAVVGRIGHNTHLECRVVAGARRLCPEADAEVGKLIYVSVDRRKDNHLVVAVSAGGGSVVPVEAAAAGVGIGGAARHIGISEIVRTVVQAVPAIDKHVGGAAAGGGDTVGGLKAHGVGQRVHSGALGAEREEADTWNIRATGRNIDIIHRIRRKTISGVGQRGGGHFSTKTTGEAMFAIL